MFSKRLLLVGLAAFSLIFSSIACDDGDGLVENMQDASTGGNEALDSLDDAVGDVIEDLTSIEAPDVYGVGEDTLSAVGDVVEDIAENSGLEAAAEGGVLTACVVGCDAMYGPLAPVFSDTEVFDACVENCSK